MSQFEKLFRESEEELRHKTLHDIQRETAWKWCARACAAASHGLHDATEYAHEAIEHAALCGDDELLGAVRSYLRHFNVDV